MTDRTRGIDRLQSRQGKDAPGAVLLLPVERRFPAIAVDAFPSGRQPELGAPIAAFFHESEILAAAHRAHRDGKGVQPAAMARPFVVEGEVSTVIADLHQPAFEFAPGQRFSRPRVPRLRRTIGWPQRVHRQRMLDVHQDQFLMLLFVMQAKFDQSMGVMLIRQEFQHDAGDVPAIGHHLLDTRPGDHPALRPRMSRADGLVVRIEEIFEGRIEWPVTRSVRSQDEGLEKPCRVREMPFGRAGIRHRLDRLVLGRQGSGEFLGARTDCLEPIEAVRQHGRQREIGHWTSARPNVVPRGSVARPAPRGHPVKVRPSP